MQPLSSTTMFVLAMQLCMHTTHSCKRITRGALSAGMLQRVADAVRHMQRRPRGHNQDQVRVLPARQAVAWL